MLLGINKPSDGFVRLTISGGVWLPIVNMTDVPRVLIVLQSGPILPADRHGPVIASNDPVN